MEKRLLPNEPKYIYELTTEAGFYKLLGLVTLIEERITDLYLYRLAVN